MVIETTHAADSYRRTYGAEPLAYAWAPGRVNLIGEHIDYAGGCVLPVSLARGVTVAAGPGTLGRIRVHSDKFLDAGVAEFSPQEPPPEAFSRFVHELALSCDTLGADIAVLSDLPVERGWSSSAAFAVAVLSALLALKEGIAKPTAIRLCRMCQTAEANALGVKCGLLDQYAAVYGRANAAVWFDPYLEKHEYVPLSLGDAVLVLVESGQSRRLALSGYNERRRELELALQELALHLGDDTHWRELDAQAMLIKLGDLSEMAEQRLRHIFTEQQRVTQFVALMAKGDLVQLGQALSASQHSLSDNYDVSTPELDALCDILAATPGIYGARLVGGGFGGGVLALMARHALEDSLPDALTSFESQSGLATEWSEAVPGEGAMVMFPGGEPELVREWLP